MAAVACAVNREAAAGSRAVNVTTTAAAAAVIHDGSQNEKKKPSLRLARLETHLFVKEIGFFCCTSNRYRTETAYLEE